MLLQQFFKIFIRAKHYFLMRNGLFMGSLPLFTSESVTEGHPDKICDQIADTIVDALLAQDPQSRVAIEAMITTGFVAIAGEVTTSGYVEIPSLVRDTIVGIGYDRSEVGFDGSQCGVLVALGEQSPDIAQGVNVALQLREHDDQDLFDAQGAGDQGIMFGYACSETAQYMPLPIWLAHRLSEQLTRVRKDGILEYLRPDGKTQVTVAYDGQVPVGIDTVVVSAQHASGVTSAKIDADIRKYVIAPILERIGYSAKNVSTFINPTGYFEIGGPKADAGVTGRKIIVDTYGGMSRHGGGALSGKDPSKVDRSAPYALRWAAKNAVAAGLAERVELHIAYAIGSSAPIGFYAETFGTGIYSDEKIVEILREVFDFRPAAIIRDLDLMRPIYASTAAYGHFGRENPQFPWEQLNRVEQLQSAAKM